MIDNTLTMAGRRRKVPLGYVPPVRDDSDSEDDQTFTFRSKRTRIEEKHRNPHSQESEHHAKT